MSDYKCILIRNDGRVETTTFEGHEAETFADLWFNTVKKGINVLFATVINGPEFGETPRHIFPAPPKLEDNFAYCIGCGCHPTGAYTCATCSEADSHEGEQAHVSNWPKGNYA